MLTVSSSFHTSKTIHFHPVISSVFQVFCMKFIQTGEKTKYWQACTPSYLMHELFEQINVFLLEIRLCGWFCIDDVFCVFVSFWRIKRHWNYFYYCQSICFICYHVSLNDLSWSLITLLDHILFILCMQMKKMSKYFGFMEWIIYTL